MHHVVLANKQTMFLFGFLVIQDSCRIKDWRREAPILFYLIVDPAYGIQSAVHTGGASSAFIIISIRWGYEPEENQGGKV